MSLACLKQRSISLESEKIITELLRYIKPKQSIGWGDDGLILSLPEVYLRDVPNDDKSWLGITSRYEVFEGLRASIPEDLIHNMSYHFFLAEAYYNAPLTLWHGGPFDFILIDGVEKMQCFRNSYHILDDNGLCILVNPDFDIVDDVWRFRKALTQKKNIYAYYKTQIVSQWIDNVINKINDG